MLFSAVLARSPLLFAWRVSAEIRHGEPQVSYNLTFEEHAAKAAVVLDPVDSITSEPPGSHLADIRKRAPVGGEINNPVPIQIILEALAEVCNAGVRRLNNPFRAVNGHCISDQLVFIHCGRTVSVGNMAKTKIHACAKNEACAEFDANNFNHYQQKFGWCGPRIEVDKRQEHGRGTGQLTGTWTPNPGNSYGSYSDFVSLLGQEVADFVFEGELGPDHKLTAVGFTAKT
ncbi:hypothetical protein CTRI78_v006305 [Colletotrichum trifolii]|uniref:Secreted in xylem 1 protein n=1 Tax=Colletotrichum trifolii TaxID=5466 RepID=A0A4R8RCV9_COLTR|nr:hypothetical protein CTRI78_v006305 [Colletotrichum trifolii]